MTQTPPSRQRTDADQDPVESREWLDAFDSLIRHEGLERAQYLLSKLAAKVTEQGALPSYNLTTPYRNTIPVTEERNMPGDMFLERRIRSLIRWNALVMVMRANMDNDDHLGGHISTFSSSATLYDIGFNYFFRASDADRLGDMIYFQGHSAPGIYARSFLEGRLSEEQIENFRREIDGRGLSSYPHPWLMPDYWQFPTVSMGLGPIMGIYQAHIMRYLSARDLVEQGGRKVWVFCGDGEMDEPESLGAITLAGREQLDNLIFVVNCNLQRLDGLVRGNGKIIQELEGAFRGAGWNVIKVVWGRHWDSLLSKDKDGRLQKIMDEVVDGEMQNFKSKGGAYTREHFFAKDPEVLKMVEHLTDDDIYRLNRGGHDPYKVYAAFAAAVEHRGQPTVILAQTVKGYGVGSREADNTTHQVEKLDIENLRAFRDRFDIPISDADLPAVPFFRPAEDSAEIRYLKERRASLGGYLPARIKDFEALPAPSGDAFKALLEGTGEREASTTMMLVRAINSLVRDKALGPRVVPIVPDEARTFGMEGMFRTLGIYSSQGQKYEPSDADQVMYYRESRDGVMLEEGLTEAGAFSAWLALATAYSNYSLPMIPIYIFYSMFGFQRIGDLAYAAGDAQARGFLIGATSGRTTLNGEGLQHQDGHSHLLAATIPNCVSYDPTYAYELAVLLAEGIRRMYIEKENCFYYITTLNENYRHPAIPEGVEEGILKGLYPIAATEAAAGAPRVRLLGCGAILREVLAAAELLRDDHGVTAEVFSATSFNCLYHDGIAVERYNLLNPTAEARQCYATTCLGAEDDSPVVAATDYQRAYANQIRAWVPGYYYVLGCDGFGRSDTRPALRRFFEVDRHWILCTALYALVQRGAFDADELVKIQRHHGLDLEAAPPWTR